MLGRPLVGTDVGGTREVVSAPTAGCSSRTTRRDRGGARATDRRPRAAPRARRRRSPARARAARPRDVRRRAPRGDPRGARSGTAPRQSAFALQLLLEEARLELRRRRWRLRAAAGEGAWVGSVGSVPFFSISTRFSFELTQLRVEARVIDDLPVPAVLAPGDRIQFLRAVREPQRVVDRWSARCSCRPGRFPASAGDSWSHSSSLRR